MVALERSEREAAAEAAAYDRQIAEEGSRLEAARKVLADAEAVLSRNAENLRAAVAEAKEWKVAAAAQKNEAQEVLAKAQEDAAARKKAERTKRDTAQAARDRERAAKVAEGPNPSRSPSPSPSPNPNPSPSPGPSPSPNLGTEQKARCRIVHYVHCSWFRLG